MERIVVGRSSTLTKTFSFTPTGTPTVVVTRSDGTVVTTGSVSGAGTSWTYTIPASSNTRLDTLTETWTATSGGSPQPFTDYIEVGTDSLFSLAEARAMAPLEKVVYTDAMIADERTLVEQELESGLGYSLFPRYRTATFTPEGGRLLISRLPLVGHVPGLGIPLVTNIVTVTINGVAVSPADVVPDEVGFYYASGWGCLHQSVTIGFEHGAQYPPQRGKEVALFEARYRLLRRNSPTDDRAVRLDTDQGSYALPQPGRGGMRFFLPDTDGFVQDYSLTVGVC